MQTIQFLTVPDRTFRLRWPPAAEDQAVFLDLCRANPDYRIELNGRGEMEIMPPTGIRTGCKNAKLISALTAWAEQEGSGETFDSSTGFRLADGATRSPDASRLAAESGWAPSVCLPSGPASGRLRWPGLHLGRSRAAGVRARPAADLGARILSCTSPYSIARKGAEKQ
jgi:hypothetical protein